MPNGLGNTPTDSVLIIVQTFQAFFQAFGAMMAFLAVSQRLEGWGNCKATSVAGDPLEGTLSSVPGLALASTGVPHAALLGDAFAMLPWARTATPWQRGSVLFRKPDGAMAPYDPTGGAIRPQVLDIFVAPPRSGKSVLANTINLGLCLSSAVLGSQGARLPLIGKADIGNSADGYRVQSIGNGPFSAVMLSVMEATAQVARPDMLLVNDLDAVWQAAQLRSRAAPQTRSSAGARP